MDKKEKRRWLISEDEKHEQLIQLLLEIRDLLKKENQITGWTESLKKGSPEEPIITVTPDWTYKWWLQYPVSPPTRIVKWNVFNSDTTGKKQG